MGDKLTPEEEMMIAEDMKKDAERLNTKTHEMVSGIRALILQFQNDIIEEMIGWKDELMKLITRITRIEHRVFGIEGDPLSGSMVGDINALRCRVDKCDEFIDKHDDAENYKQGYANGRKKAATIDIKKREITVKWGTALIALAAVMITEAAPIIILFATRGG